MAAYRMDGFSLTGGNAPRRIPGGLVSAGFFRLLGASPAMGRFFTEEEDVPGAARVVVLAHHVWQERFGSDREIIGRSLTLDGAPYTVIGVAPAGFRYFQRSADVYVPLGLWGDKTSWLDRGNHQGLLTLARLKPDVSVKTARAEMNTIARQLEALYPRSNSGQRVTMEPLFESQVGEARPSLLMLLACVGLVLALTCANVANLVIARGSSPEREIVVRAALGAGRGRVIRQLLTESVLLAAIGGAVGLLIAVWGIDPLIRLAPSNIPRLDMARVDLRVLAFTFGVAVVTGLLFGVAPALQASRVDLTESLKRGASSVTSGPARRRLQTALMVVEVALALMVVTGAGLMVRSILAVNRVHPGLNPDGVLALDLVLPETKYGTPESWRAFLDQALERLRALPGVESASGVLCLPLAGDCWSSVYMVEGLPVPSQDKLPVSAFNAVASDYFRTLQIPLIEGRLLTHADGTSAPSVVLINETMARRHWPGQSPLGRRLKQGFPQDDTPWREIVGVVADCRQSGPERDPEPEVFLPFTQASDSSMSLIVKTLGDSALPAGAVISEIHRLDPDQPVDNIRPMSRYLADSVARRRFATLLLGMFASLALVLAAVGIYGVVSCGVTARTHEIGIRMALGARGGDVARLVLWQGMKRTLAGVAAGLVAAAALTRFMSGLLFAVTPTDPITFSSIAALLGLVALAACWPPARRAMRVDPMVALRYE